MNKKFTTIFLLFFLMSCQAAKDGLTGKKRTNADEFLVEKKNPLVLPPSYGKLPTPEGQQNIGEEVDSNNVQELLTTEKNIEIDQSNKSTESNIEKSILEKIKN